MKRKLLLILILICPLFINACSCDKFDHNTYKSAVKNFKNSTGLDYKLEVTTYTEGENGYLLEESTYKYQLTTTREVTNFASNIKMYQVISSEHGANSAPTKVYELNRYFVGEENAFYTNHLANVDNREKEYISYEEKYDSESIYHIDNIVPVFEYEEISNFKIEKDSSKKGYSTVTFDAACLSYSEVECTEEVTSYKITIDKNYNFKKLEYTVVSNNKTIDYKYEFLNYNSDVEIVFPDDLANY